jgi:hypothetical protein
MHYLMYLKPGDKGKEADLNSGSTSRRGYGWTHQKLRNRWARDVARGEVECARCGEPIWPEEPWDLGHVDGDKTRYAGPEHRACNRATAIRRAKRRRRVQVAFVGDVGDDGVVFIGEQSRGRTSRNW